jgi:hypothetical protein
VAKRNERREFDRFKVSFPVHIEHAAGTERKVEKTRLIDLSADGALFSSGIGLRPGDEVVVSITTPGNFAGNLLAGDQSSAAEVVFTSTAVVLRNEKARQGKSGKEEVAVQFTGPLRITGKEEKRAK